mgnify:CR=1 FL=1
MQKAIYTTVGIDELLSHVQALKGVGARFVQMHAERNVDDGTYRLVYTFINVHAAQEHIAQDGSYAIENLVVEGIDRYQEIPSISSYYPAVSFFFAEWQRKYKLSSHTLSTYHIYILTMCLHDFFNYRQAKSRTALILSAG